MSYTCNYISLKIIFFKFEREMGYFFMFIIIFLVCLFEHILILEIIALTKE